MAEKSPGYTAYMLRIWSAGNSHKTFWRASLENAHTGEKRNFASLEDLFTYLHVQTGDRSIAKEVKPLKHKP